MSSEKELSTSELRIKLRGAWNAYRLIPEYSMKLKRDLELGRITEAQFESAQKVGFKGKSLHEWVVYFTGRIAYFEGLIDEKRKAKLLMIE